MRTELPPGIKASPIANVRPLAAALLGCVALVIGSEPSEAKTRKDKGPVEPVAAADRPVGPLVMVISIKKQRMSAYDSLGLVAQTRISSGMAGYDSPQGIFSILEKKREHYSNIYGGAPMPYMQRVTWSGVAMHAGVVPGHPASHGCIRLPYGFARGFFELTTKNQRVIIARDEIAPVSISHPRLFKALPPGTPQPTTPDAAVPLAASTPAGESTSDVPSLLGVTPAAAALSPTRTLASVAIDRVVQRERLVKAIDETSAARASADAAVPAGAAAADAARKVAREARAKADQLQRELAKVVRAKATAEQRFTDLMKRLSAAHSKKSPTPEQFAKHQQQESAEEARLLELTDAVEAASRAAEAQKSAAAAREAAATKADRVRRATADRAKAAALTEAAAVKAVDEFDRVEKLRFNPVSVFVSAKSRRLLVRQGMEPVLEVPITVEQPETPLGTHIYTAMGWQNGSQTELDWSVVSYGDNAPLVADTRSKNAKKVAALTTTAAPSNAVDALNRVQIPQETLDLITELVKPGSSLIVTDYDTSRREFGRGTDFIVELPRSLWYAARPGYERMQTASVTTERKKKRRTASSRRRPPPVYYYSYW